MKKRIIAFGASNSKASINKKLAEYTASRLENAEVEILDLNDFQLPLYSIDYEAEKGMPSAAMRFKDCLDKADGLVISFAEHNGAYTAVFKNLYDWISRIDRKAWQDKSMMLLSTSPGPGGAKSALELGRKAVAFGSSSTVATFSLPSFHSNFQEARGIINESLEKAFLSQLTLFRTSMSEQQVEANS